MSLSRKNRSTPIQLKTFVGFKPQAVIGAIGILISLIYMLLGYAEAMVPVCVAAIISLTIVQITGHETTYISYYLQL